MEAKTFNTFDNYFCDAALQPKQISKIILKMKHNQSRGEDHKHTKRTNGKKKPFGKGTVAKDENLATVPSKDSKNEKIQKAVQMIVLENHFN